MDSNLKGIVGIVVLLGIIGVASYFAAKRSGKSGEKGLSHTVILMCSDPACGKIFPQRIIAGQPPPYKCKYCGKMTAYRAVRCDNCGEVFPYIIRQVPTERGQEEIGTTECPECGYDRFTLIRSMDELKGSAAQAE